MASRPEPPRVERGQVLTIGVVGGVVGGLIGGGSGVLFVPALDRFTTLTRAQVHGTSTIANVPVCAAGAAVYGLVGGSLDLRAGGGMMLGGILGGVFGARLLARASERVLRSLLVAVLLLTAAKLYLDAAGLDPSQGAPVVPAHLLTDPWFVVPATVAAGLVIGAWAGAMGLGGGLLAVPTLVLLFGVDLHTAAGTALLVFVPNSLVGGLVHVRQGTASLRIGTLMGGAAAPGTVAGALLGLALDDVVLGVVFGTFALTMAVREIAHLRRTRVPDDR
ncbi:sulfite exporter TauE/SafE family protein [Actinomycetospora sp.]|uniref:sulfite exporter TauE/SafE family protein n=1 Tax=Actinomycetospora sp. TaxID=1872135 RepID=UPI002F3EA924